MPKERIDLRGKRIGRLTVLEPDGFKTTASGSRQYFWKCLCDCGTECRVDGCCLRRASTVSCGCYAKDLSTTHELSGHYIYSVWLGMKQRCYNKNSSCYKDYGARGIRICESWLESPANMLRDLGERPTSKHTIERKNNDGNYEPGNCVWATRAEQNENTRQTKLLTHKGITLSIAKWGRRLGVGRDLIRNRLKLGWSVAEALDTPRLKYGVKRHNLSSVS